MAPSSKPPPRVVGQVKGPRHVLMIWGGIFAAGLATFSWAKIDIYQRKVDNLKSKREAAAMERRAAAAASKATESAAQ